MYYKVLLFLFALLINSPNYAQLNLSGSSTSYTIDFDNTTDGVNQGAFGGTGLSNAPANGQLNSGAWAVTGMSDGGHTFGQTATSGDFARGASNGGVSTGGLYAFDTGSNNKAIGFQPTGSDWTPGSLTLQVVNGQSSTINELDLDYTVYVFNDQSRANSFNFSYSLDNINYTTVSAVSLTSGSNPDASPTWNANNKNLSLTGLGLSPGASLYLRWSSSDAGGSGSRDEFALDDIVLSTSGSVPPCIEPAAQASSLGFGTITDNSIQGSFGLASADKYLVIQSTSNSLNSSPADGVIYSPGNTLGNGTIIQYSNTNNFTATGLSASTTYFYFIFTANDNCSGGPDYLVNTPLNGSATTLADQNTDYYASINGQTCAALKTALHNLIKDHIEYSYGDLWTIYQTTDDRLNDAGNSTIVWDMYSDNPAGAETEFTFVNNQCGTYNSEADCYNREHTFPKSWWGGSTSVPQYTDVFCVIPVDGWINGIRNNNPYGIVLAGSESQITTNGSKLGPSAISIPGYNGNVFEPIDQYKGDLARNYFYMLTRYEDGIASWENNTVESDAVLDGLTYPGLEQWAINMLIDWHNNDPVSQKEIDRNNEIFNYQLNRNPFIDHPEYAAQIWQSCGGSDTQAPSAPASLAAANITDNSVDLSWNASTDNVGVTGYNIYQDGIVVTSTSATVSGTTISGLLASTSYDFYVTASDAAGNESTASNLLTITTQTPLDNQAPTAPSVLTASNTTETTTDLSWSASTDNVAVTGYHVYQDGVVVVSTNASNTNVTISGLLASNTYDFNVTAFDAAGNESSVSNAVSVTTQSTPGGPTVIHEGYFESGWDGWVDGGNDAQRYSGSRSPEGSFSIQLRDNSGVNSSMTSPALDLSSYSSVEVAFQFYANSFENNEDFWLRYNDGSGWVTVATFTRGTDFQNRIDYSLSVTLDAASYNFTNNGQFRFQADASANNDQVYIDAVVITGDPVNGSNILVHHAPVIAEDLPKGNLDNSAPDKDYGITVFPNPASDYLLINLPANRSVQALEVFNNLGQLMQINHERDNNKRLQVALFPAGLYHLQIVDDLGETHALIFMKQ